MNNLLVTWKKLWNNPHYELYASQCCPPIVFRAGKYHIFWGLMATKLLSVLPFGPYLCLRGLAGPLKLFCCQRPHKNLRQNMSSCNTNSIQEYFDQVNPQYTISSCNPLDLILSTSVWPFGSHLCLRGPQDLQTVLFAQRPHNTRKAGRQFRGPGRTNSS